MKMKTKMIVTILIGMLILISGCSKEKQDTNDVKQEDKPEAAVNFEIVEDKNLNIEQIRGIGYPGNDTALYIAADDGVKMYKDNQWFETTTNHHDLLGFQAVEDGFIASGKPQKGTGLKNPLGIVHSNDKGKSLQKLAFYGENNFYFMAASFQGDDIYVINQEADENLVLGVNYSTDKGKTWKESALTGFKSDSLGMLAVHSQKGNVVAMATRSGIYYSEDHANTMTLMTDPYMVTALTFSGEELLFSSVENESIQLKLLNPKSGEVTALSIPFLAYQNPITFLAVNPKNPQQIAFSTYNNDLYESRDGGNSWTNLFLNGKTESE